MNEIKSVCAVRAAIQADAQLAQAEEIAAQVVRNVCELPDYTSPDDQPDLLTCTAAELHLCVMRALGQDV
jgi:hypothetical protein